MLLLVLSLSTCLTYVSVCSEQNKSAFLCGVMKTYRQREKQGTKVSDSNKGPDEAKIKVSLSSNNNDYFNKFLISVCHSLHLSFCMLLRSTLFIKTC